MEHNTPKQFALQLGSLISLYLSLGFLLVLLFGISNILLPDPTDSLWQINAAQEQVRLGIAMVVVFFPTYLILTRLVNKARRQAPQGSYLTLTKWLIYLSLLVGGGVLLGDLVAVINTFLDGEITSRFLLKAAAVLLVVGAAFFYYIQDARGFWVEREKCSIRFGVMTTTLVLASLVGGFLMIDGPSAVREQKIDEAQLRDLSEIQSRIGNYLAIEGELPENLAVAYGELTVPTAPEGRAPYRYELFEDGFQLCASFIEASKQGRGMYMQPILVPMKMHTIANADDWEHNAGDWCFERTVIDVEGDSATLEPYEEFTI